MTRIVSKSGACIVNMPAKILSNGLSCICSNVNEDSCIIGKNKMISKILTDKKAIIQIIKLLMIEKRNKMMTSKKKLINVSRGLKEF